MKNTLRGLAGIVGALVLCLALNLPSTASAGGPPKGIDPEHHELCTIYNSLWDNNTGDGGISLRTAIYYANNPQEHKSCYKKITLASDVIMTSPLVINRDNLEIDGAGYVLDVKKMDPNAETDEQKGNGCAIYIRANNVIIKDLSIGGDNGASYAGICFGGANNKLDGVTISGGQYGIIFTENSFGNRVLPNVRVSNVSEFGIDDRSNGQANIVIMDNRQGKVDAKGYEEVDNDGIVEWKPNAYFTVEQMLMDDVNFVADSPAGSVPYQVSLGGTKGLLRSHRTIMPLISKIDQKGMSGRYEIAGIFKSVSGDDSVGQQDCNVADAGADRLAVFSLSGTVIKYVAMVGRNSSKGIDDDGTFQFYIDTNNNPEEFGGVNSFYLVPVSRDWELIGRSSKRYSTSDVPSDCTSGTGPSGGGSGPGGSGGEGGLMGYTSVAECNADNAWQNGQVDEDKDSDLDGIPDFIEMRVRKKIVNNVEQYV
ncbi:MAG: hypothetical protein ABH871_07880, partial [Pseudomonadota bacterium]